MPDAEFYKRKNLSLFTRLNWWRTSKLGAAKNMKIVYILSGLSKQNGITSFVMNYYKFMNHDKFHFTFVVMNDEESEYKELIENNNDKIVVLPPIKEVDKFFKEIKRVFKEEQYDIVHSHLMNIGWLFLGMAKIYSPNTVRVLHAHATVFGETKWKNIRNKFFSKFSINLADKLMACSKAAGKALYGSRNYTVINNAIDVNKYKFDLKTREQIRQKFSCGTKFVIGTTARMEIQKNPLFAVEVFHEMLKYSDQIEYWWVGDGTLREQVEKRIEELGIKEQFKLLGKRNDAHILYQGMDLFFLPSFFEGLPVVAVEAEASGLPIVLADSITREIECNNSKYISLSLNAKVWSEEVYNWLKMNQEEFSKRISFLNSDFDIRAQTKVLENEYLKLNTSDSEVK